MYPPGVYTLYEFYEDRIYEQLINYHIYNILVVQ